MRLSLRRTPKPVKPYWSEGLPIYRSLSDVLESRWIYIVHWLDRKNTAPRLVNSDHLALLWQTRPRSDVLDDLVTIDRCCIYLETRDQSYNGRGWVILIRPGGDDG